jgi:hypothetical protein
MTALEAALAAYQISLDETDLRPVLLRGVFRHRNLVIKQRARELVKYTGFDAILRDEYLTRRGDGEWTIPGDEFGGLDGLLMKLSKKGDDRWFLWGKIAGRGATAADAVPALTQLLLAEDERFVEASLGAFAAIGPKAVGAVPAIQERLTGREERSRIAAALALAAIGQPAKAARTALQDLLAEPSPELRLAVTFALARIDNDLPGYRKQIIRLFRISTGGGAYLPTAAGQVLATLGGEYPELLPFSVGWLQWPYGELKEYVDAVLRGYSKAGAHARELVPLLRHMLDASFEPANVCAALGALGPAARDAALDLRRYLDHPDYRVARAAREALRRIERGAAPSN